MSGMQNKFHSDVGESHRAADRYRKLIDVLKKRAQENPELLAKRIVEVVPVSLEKYRSDALEQLGLDLADVEAVSSYKANSVAKWQILSWLSTRHQIYSGFLRLVGQYFRDPNLARCRRRVLVARCI